MRFYCCDRFKEISEALSCEWCPDYDEFNYCPYCGTKLDYRKHLIEINKEKAMSSV
jgi:hypothetical protein